MRLFSFASNYLSRVQSTINQTIDKITSTEDNTSVEDATVELDRNQVSENAEPGLDTLIPDSEVQGPDSMESTARVPIARAPDLEPIDEVDERSSIRSSILSALSSCESTASSSCSNTLTRTSSSTSSSFLSCSSSSILSRLSQSASTSSSSSGFTFGSKPSSGISFGSRSSLGLGSGLGKTFEKNTTFIWDFGSRRRFQEAAALHSILNPQIINGEDKRPMPLPTPPPTPIYSATANFPVGDEDDVMSTITVSGNSSETRELVDQFAFIAGAAAEKGKGSVVKKDDGVVITGGYWGQEESWKEADRENMTAVCIERWSREGQSGKAENGVTFRMAMNNGVPLEVLEWLKGVTGIMEQCARGLRSELDSEDVLWTLVVEMNQRKIYDDIIKRLYVPASKTGDVNTSTPTVASKIVPILKQNSTALTGSKLTGEAVSIRDGAASLSKVHKLCERIVEQGLQCEVRLLKELLIHCYHLRRSRTFRAFLFSFEEGYELFRTIQKLGRYRIATQALVDAIRANPSQFYNVEVHCVQPPSCYDLNASIYPDADLRSYLRNILKTWRITSVSKEIFEQLRVHFRDRCAEMPVVHAEMQLVKYYEENPKEQLPTLIGCSKKPCQVCVRFLHLHGRFQVEKAHARISHRWAIPNIRCRSSEATDNIGDILNTISREMEDSLREVINLGPQKPSKLREVSKSSTFLSPHDIVPTSKNAGARIAVEIPHTSSFDSGFVDSSASSFESFDGAIIRDWYGDLSDIANSNPGTPPPVTPPPLHRLYHPPPPIPNSPPPLRRRRGSPGSLSEEYKIHETFGVRLRPVNMQAPVQRSAAPGEGQNSLRSVLPPHQDGNGHSLLHRASSPTLGWNTRFPRHSADSPATICSALAAPPATPPDSEAEEDTGPSESIPNLQVFHGSQSSGLNEIPPEAQQPLVLRPSDPPLDPAGIFYQNRRRRRSTSPDRRSSAASSHRWLDRDSLGGSEISPYNTSPHKRCSRESRSSSEISPPPTPQEGGANGDINSPDPLHISPLHELSPISSKRNSVERKTVDVEIIDSTSPNRNVVYDIDEIGRLPTPQHSLYSQNHDRPISPPRSRSKTPLQDPGPQQQPRHKPPANIPHIIISSTAHPHQPLPQPGKPPLAEPLYTSGSSYLSPTTPPSSSSSSSSSLLSSAYTPSLSRRHNRLRLPPTGSPSPPLTPPHYSSSALESQLQESELSTTPSYSTSSNSYFTCSSTSYCSGSSGSTSYLSGSNQSTTTSHIAIPMDEALGSLEQEVERTIRLAHRPSSLPRAQDPGGDFRNNWQDNQHSRQSYPSTAIMSQVPEPPGVKSFLLRAVNKQQQHRHPAGGGESISWISLDIGEDLLRGSEKFEVTAQLLDPGKWAQRKRVCSLDRDKGRVDAGGGGAGGSNGLVLHHEYDKDTDRLVLDIDFGGAVLRLKIYW